VRRPQAPAAVTLRRELERGHRPNEVAAVR